MKKILVPTDFSRNAKAAFKYAMKLAQLLEAQVTVVNIYHPSATVVNESPLPIDGALLQLNRERLAEFVASDDQASGMVSQRVEIGFAVDKLVELSDTGEFDLIVMGATGETGLMEKVFGKVSLSVAARANCPVLLVPQDASFSQIHKIMYATNFAAINMSVLLKIEKLSRNLNAKIHLVHVADQDKNIQELEDLKKKLPSLNAVMDTIASESVADGLETYASENNTDWMVIVKPHLNFWQRLTHKSKTNPIVMNPKIPLMVMH